MRCVRGLLGLSALTFLAACAVDLPGRVPDGSTLDGQGITDGLTFSDKPKLDPNCGNGQLDGSERCDIAIPSGQAGACPTSCDDGLACTRDEVQAPGTCAATCTFTALSACISGDACCPAGCTAATDDDCSKNCGNGQLDAKETCDTAIAMGQAGACPTTCDDGKACTADVLLNGATCAAQCTHNAIKTCTDGDGCCPAGCNSSSDDDCFPTCGNGVLDPGEKCDTAIAQGQAGACPSSCDDGKTCTADAVLYSGTCSAQCSFTPIAQCKNSDGCCPTGCTPNNDNDCSCPFGNLFDSVPTLPTLCRPFAIPAATPAVADPPQCQSSPQVTLGSGNDTFDGSDTVKDYVAGLDGDDTIRGLGCSDTLNGNAGNDWLNGNAGNDSVRGGAGNDTIYGGSGNDTLAGDTNDDFLSGDFGDDTYNFAEGDGNDVIDETGGMDTIACVASSGRPRARIVAWSQVGSDLRLTMSAGGSITIKRYFSDPNASIDRIVDCQ